MEKYTFDIDKVLDDFEETEALKNDKNVGTPVLQPILNTEEMFNRKDPAYKFNTIDKCTINLDDKKSVCIDSSALRNIIPDVNKSSEICINSGKNTLQNTVPDVTNFLASCGNSLLNINSNDQEYKLTGLVNKENNTDIKCNMNSLKKDSGILQVNEHKVSEISEKLLTDKNSKSIFNISLSSDISHNFELSLLKDQNSLPSLNKSEDNAVEYSDNKFENTVSDTIKKSQVNICTKSVAEPQTTESYIPNHEISHNDSKIKFELNTNLHKNDTCFNKISEHTCSGLSYEKFSNVSHLIENGAHALDLEDLNLQQNDNLQLDHSYITPHYSSEEDKNSSNEVTSDLCPVNKENENDRVEDRNDEVRDIYAENSNDQFQGENYQIQNINELHEPEPHRRDLQDLELENVSDEDSGVSSDEAGTSPLIFLNNQMFNFNESAAEDIKNQKLESQNVCSSDDNAAILENLKSEVTCSLVHNSEVDYENALLVNNDITDNQSLGDKAGPSQCVVIQSDKFTGARPKLENIVQISHLHNNHTEENQTAVNLETHICINESETLIPENALQKCDDLDGLSTDFLDSCKNTDCNNLKKTECERERDSSAISGHASKELKYIGIENEYNSEQAKCDSQEINIETEEIGQLYEENKISSKNAYCFTETSCNNSEINSVNTEIEIATNPDSQSDILPQRLTRPTTLDLPSRHTAIPQSASETENILIENNDLSSRNENFLSNENLLDCEATEPSVKQQPQIGLVKPFWVPDSDAPNCMHCGMKFTVIKRRHHCRACGKVLCSRCCNLKAKLAYLNKEEKICHPCFEILSSTSQNENVSTPTADSQSSSSCGSSPNFSPSPQAPTANLKDKNSWRPHPNNPDDYCSTIPPLQQIQISETKPPPTVMVPIGVLKRDGIRPGGDLTDLTEPVDAIPVYRRIGRKRVEKISSATGFSSSKSKQRRVIVSDEEGQLPPLILQNDDNEDSIEWNQVLQKMQDDNEKPITFALLKNMHLCVKLTKLDCCFGKECWCFVSNGLCSVGQDEVMFILERLPNENTLPRGVLTLFTHVYDNASKGSTIDDLGHIIFPDQILGSSDHRGFLFIRPTFQCLSKLILPSTPFLVAILIHKWEVPWAKVFPLRLMLRLGAECRYYPCALVSVRYRKPVFYEIGQTIMSVLADLRNFQFTIPVILGLVIHMEDKKTCVNIPRNRYEKVMKILNSNNVEHVLALGANFSSEADSHLVCIQKEEGDYQTQAINIENTTRRVTGASFIVFSGALKSSSGLSAKFSIVEDGLLVQIPQETMVSLHLALRNMKDLTIECGQINANEPEEVVIVQWVRDDKKFNIGVRSPIDGKSLEGITSVRIHTSTDYAGDNYLIRWTELFFLEIDDCSSSIQHELVDPCRLAESVAQSCCMALVPHLDQLAESELTKIGLRVTLDSEKDKVEYEIGACEKPLPASYMNTLDCGLIPVMMRLSGSGYGEAISFELIFHILIK